ncbi:hypothetical protein XELAEV_18034448mg [Xenopus laevis]|uniref:Uncharacterized protein n=1 Tax=Xenopus laevis TaxID=8355 RepID=A0A974CE11_XENLA|nr:hypothetical protein XELAEV_18034448mg [Xenopus laevis]
MVLDVTLMFGIFSFHDFPGDCRATHHIHRHLLRLLGLSVQCAVFIIFTYVATLLCACHPITYRQHKWLLIKL